MIIFGYRTILKNIGVVFKKMCDHCHNEDYWVLTKVTRWFTLFFIPVIPVSSKYHLTCPICKYGLVLNGDQVEKVKPIAEVNQLLVDRKITELEHQTRLNQLNGESNNHVETKTTNPQALGDGSRKSNFCESCGTPVTLEIKFCGNCGVAVVNNK
jgi:hypothetical protein